MRGRRSGAVVRARDDEDAPLHSPKLTQRRAHPAVVHSTPAGEPKRPRVRRSHEEKTRGGVGRFPTVRLAWRDCVSSFGHFGLAVPPVSSSSCFRYQDSCHYSSPSARRAAALFAPRWEGLGALSAAGKRRQYLNLYGRSELPLKILLVCRAPIDQHRARLDHCVETRIGARQAGESEGFSDRLGLDLLFGDARCGLGPCPVMKGNRHHCVTLKHALRPFRGG
jgi:hypothetical protein